MLQLFRKKQVSAAAIVFLLLPLKTIAQDNNPISKISISSPTAASLGKYGDIPVNYHTGIPQISIPIYTVSAGPLSLPIGLSYHASGLKVQEPASWVGAGWSLSAGGVITRSVMGAPDERGTNNGGNQTHGHFSDYGYNNYINNSQGYQDWNGFAKGYKDGEPDLFFFNFGSYSGKFYFRDDRTSVIVPEQDIRIEPAYDGVGNASIQSFVITTPDGVQYTFGNTAGVTGAAPIEITKPITAVNGLSTANTVSSWFLNKIATADGLFSITLNYVAENYGYHTLSMFPIDGVPQGGGTFGSTRGYDLVKNIVQGVRLNQIVFPNGTVNFIGAATGRTDLSDNTTTLLSDITNTAAKSLGSIEISDGVTVQRKFNFTYSYFTDNTTALATDLNNFAPNLQTDKRRLKLDQVQELSGDGTVTKPPYYFTYFSEQVPRRLSFGIDHWGFYNGVTNNAGLIPTYTQIGSTVTNNYPGANRDAAWPAMRGGTLQQINYPTGGYTLFEFEPNNIYSTKTSTVTTNVTLASVYVHLFGQSTLTMTSSFVTDGTAMNIAYNNSSNYPNTFKIVNSSNVQVYSTNVAEGQVSNTNPLTLPAGTYQATITLPNAGNLTGGATATITQWQTSQVTTNNTLTVGGNRIKTITNNDGVTANNVVTTYSYIDDNTGQSSGLLFSRPIYVGVIRNDLIRDVGYWTVNGFVPSGIPNGCTSLIDAVYYKSTNSIRPMATSQGNHIGYAQVKVSQSGNGYSIYKYRGSTGVPSWQQNPGDIAVTIVNNAGCDANAPNYPNAPLPFDYMRGELQYEAQYNQSAQLLKETTYTPTYVNSTVLTPCFTAVALGQQLLATNYTVGTARKMQTVVTQTAYNPAGGSLTTTSTSYNESPWHHEVTRTSSTNSEGEVLETKKKYAFDFRLSTCDGIADGYTQYTTDCNTCSTAKTTAMALCQPGQPGITYNQCITNAYLAYLQCLTNARVNYVNYRKTNFTNLVPLNTFQANHNTAKNGAGTELKPILQLQDDFANPSIEITQWKNGNLMGAGFSRYDYSTTPANEVYINKVQSISLAATSATFTAAATNGTNNGIVKDSRYVDETTAKFYNGNLAEITGKDGVTTAYIWGHNNTLPIVKSIGVSQATLLAAYNAVSGNLATIRSQPSLAGAQLNTYTYTPVIGMTAETDVNSKTISYEYDKLGRLLLARDFNNNILKQYDYQYQVMPPNVAAQWVAAGKTRCKSCPQNSSYITGTQQQQQKDNNPASATYNNLRWADIGPSASCISNADWQNTATPQRCKKNSFMQYTGEQEQEQMDMNPCSGTYGQLQWVVSGTNTTACPLPATCAGGNCTGLDKKCVGTVCETATKVYTSTVYNATSGQWVCTWHYHWTDGSNSANYTESAGAACQLN